MRVIADTSPLNYLVWIESVEILPQLYGGVLIPPEVRDELLVTVAPCERAALALAAARQPSTLLIDERASTEIARAQGFS